MHGTGVSLGHTLRTLIWENRLRKQKFVAKNPFTKLEARADLGTVIAS